MNHEWDFRGFPKIWEDTAIVDSNGTQRVGHQQPRKWRCGMMLEAANTKIASRSYIQDLGEFPSLIEAIFFHSLQLPPCFKMFSYPYVGGTIHQNNCLKLYPDSKQMPPRVHLQKKNEKRKRLVVDVARAQFLQLAEAAEAVFQLQDGVGSPDRAAVMALMDISCELTNNWNHMGISPTSHGI